MLIDGKDAPWMVGMIELEGFPPLSAVLLPSSLCYAAQSCLLIAIITMIITTNIPVNRMAGWQQGFVQWRGGIQEVSSQTYV